MVKLSQLIIGDEAWGYHTGDPMLSKNVLIPTDTIANRRIISSQRKRMC